MKKLINEIIEFGNDMSRHNSAAYAASVAFFFILSLLPSLMFVSSLIKFLPITEKDFENLVLQIVPTVLDDTAKGLIHDVYGVSKGFMPITAIATLWSAGMGIMGLIRGLNGILGIEDKRNYFQIRGISTLYTFLFFIVIIIAMVLVAFGHTLSNTLLRVFPQLSGIVSTIINLRSLILIVLMFVIFDLVYSFLPGERQNMILQLPGALVSAVGWWIFTFLMSIYIEYFNGFSLYGNMITIICFLFWFYACFNILIFGAFLNKYYKKQFGNGFVIVSQKRQNIMNRKQERKNTDKQ